MFHYTKAVLKNGYKIVFGYFKWMRYYAKYPEKTPLNIRYSKLQKLLKSVMDSFNCDYKVVGLENLPNEACVLMCNHMSMYDPLAIISNIDKPMAIVAKKEIEKYPFVAKCFKSIDGCFLDREDLKQSLRLMLKIEEDLKKGNKNWLIYPEGTRNKDPKRVLGDFHHGTFRAPMRAGVPIVPVAIYGTQRVTKFKPQYRRYPVYIEIGTPLYSSDYDGMNTEEVAKLIRNKVQQMITYNARPFDDEFMNKYNKKKYIKFEK